MKRIKAKKPNLLSNPKGKQLRFNKQVKSLRKSRLAYIYPEEFIG